MRDLAPMLAEKQELISRCPAQLVGGIASASATAAAAAAAAPSPICLVLAAGHAGRSCRRNFPPRISIADSAGPAQLSWQPWHLVVSQAPQRNREVG